MEVLSTILCLLEFIFEWDECRGNFKIQILQGTKDFFESRAAHSHPRVHSYTITYTYAVPSTSLTISPNIAMHSQYLPLTCAAHTATSIPTSNQPLALQTTLQQFTSEVIVHIIVQIIHNGTSLILTLKMKDWAMEEEEKWNKCLLKLACAMYQVGLLGISWGCYLLFVFELN